MKKTLILIITTLGLAACGGGAGLELPGVPGVPGTGASTPGFDTRDYPGDTTMRTWRDSSPYRWVGYYLPGPCYTGQTWQGRRATLERMGWGLAVLFVGEQDWSAMPLSSDAANPAADAEPRCTASNLTPEKGREHAAAAMSAARGDGFPAGTVVYLDVEPVSRVSAELAAYVGAWFDAMLDAGEYEPGLYVHGDNAGRLYTLATSAFAAAGRPDAPRLWIARSGDFSLEATPAASGFPGATIWQGLHDVRETWGGITLRIDANVAAGRNPSGPR